MLLKAAKATRGSSQFINSISRRTAAGAACRASDIASP
jgi:hypothetical protein